MGPRAKSAVLLGATLLIGIVIGALVSGAIAKHRLARVAELRHAAGLRHHFEHMIEPESEAQREAIREVLDEAAPRFEGIMRDAHRDLRAARDSLRTELDAILTDEQKERLDAHLRRPGPGREGHLRPPPERRRERLERRRESNGAPSEAPPR